MPVQKARTTKADPLCLCLNMPHTGPASNRTTRKLLRCRIPAQAGTPGRPVVRIAPPCRPVASRPTVPTAPETPRSLDQELGSAWISTAEDCSLPSSEINNCNAPARRSVRHGVQVPPRFTPVFIPLTPVPSLEAWLQAAVAAGRLLPPTPPVPHQAPKAAEPRSATAPTAARRAF